MHVFACIVCHNMISVRCCYINAIVSSLIASERVGGGPINQAQAVAQKPYACMHIWRLQR